MLLFGEMRNNIPLVDFSKVIEETIMIYSTTPQAVFNQFKQIDQDIHSGKIVSSQFDSSDYYFTLTPTEFQAICSSDLKNLLIIDVLVFRLFYDF